MNFMDKSPRQTVDLSTWGTRWSIEKRDYFWRLIVNLTSRIAAYIVHVFHLAEKRKRKNTSTLSSVFVKSAGVYIF
jgi:hypothetical protein